MQCALAFEICLGIHSMRCMPISVSVTKCPVALLVNFTITLGDKRGQTRSKCPLNSTPQKGKSTKSRLNVQTKKEKEKKKETTTNVSSNVNKTH